MSLSAYLAKNYLNADSNVSSDVSTRPRKRRKKDKSATGPASFIIADDDLLLSSNTTAADENDEDGPLLDSTARSAEFRRAKKNSWKTVGATAPRDSEQAAADRILAAAAVERSAARAEVDEEDAPAIVSGMGEAPNEPRMESGARAGLQTAAETEVLTLQEEQRRRAEQKLAKSSKTKALPEETVYRDATGRRIDVSMKRAEARAAEQERLRQERKDKEDALGDVQRREKEQRKKDVEEARFLGVSRYADDEEMNEELRKQRRWDDPMAQYMAEKEAEERPRGQTAGGDAPRTKVYQGAAPPNRYGILPGWHWDGVDRGNGFEKQWFQARGRKSRNENLEYQWQMDE